MKIYRLTNILFVGVFLLLFLGKSNAQLPTVEWIRPETDKDPAVWGMKDGIVFGLWPASIESARKEMSGGPRGLIQVGYEFMERIYNINFIAIEPVVDGKTEFSEISPSRVDNRWGKLMWVGTEKDPGAFFPTAKSRGTISHPVANRPDIEELSVYVYMEKYLNGAHPYFRISIRSDRPEEIAIEIFHQEGGVQMDRCVLAATMGNYARTRLLYLKKEVVDSRKLYQGFDGIDFIEKEPYSQDQLMTNKAGDYIALIASNEDFEELAAWPQTEAYFRKWNWRYRPFFKVIQYWRKKVDEDEPDLNVRVNGRARYWSGGSREADNYVIIPGGPAFENFEIRQAYKPGQTFYFGISRMDVEEFLSNQVQ